MKEKDRIVETRPRRPTVTAEEKKKDTRYVESSKVEETATDNEGEFEDPELG
jgi:hypothetical protein